MSFSFGVDSGMLSTSDDFVKMTTAVPVTRVPYGEPKPTAIPAQTNNNPAKLPSAKLYWISTRLSTRLSNVPRA